MLHTVKTWRKKGLLAGDSIHPTPKGADIQEEALALALEEGLLAYLERQ